MNSLALISNLFGPQGMLIILVLTLLFGAKKLPELGKSLGETVREFNKSKEEREKEEQEEAERKKLAEKK